MGFRALKKMKLGTAWGGGCGQGRRREQQGRNAEGCGCDQAYRALDCHFLMQNPLRRMETKCDTIRIYTPLQSVYVAPITENSSFSKQL